jgi:hypothetical protein
VEDVHVLPGHLHGVLNVSGAEGGHECDVVVVGLVQLLNGVGDEVVVQLGERLVVNLDGGVQVRCRPELARSSADAGAQVLLVCSSWVPGTHKTEQWLALNAARAIENSVYVAGVCQAPPVSVGRSVLVDPMGVVEADLGLEPGVLTVEVSRETVDRVRESFPMFRQRRL